MLMLKETCIQIKNKKKSQEKITLRNESIKELSVNVIIFEVELKMWLR